MALSRFLTLAFSSCSNLQILRFHTNTICLFSPSLSLSWSSLLLPNKQKNTVQGPDNIWAHWPVTLLTRKQLARPICRLDLIPDIHMCTSVTLKHTENDSELCQTKQVTVLAAPKRMTFLGHARIRPKAPVSLT